MSVRSSKIEGRIKKKKNHLCIVVVLFFFSLGVCRLFPASATRLVRSLVSFVCARVQASECSRPVCLHTSVWKSPSDESGVLAEEESQFLLCSSMRSFCSPGTMDSSGVMFLKLSQELWPSGFDLSWWRRRRRDKEGRERKKNRQAYEVKEAAVGWSLQVQQRWKSHKKGVNN